MSSTPLSNRALYGKILSGSATLCLAVMLSHGIAAAQEATVASEGAPAEGEAEKAVDENGKPVEKDAADGTPASPDGEKPALPLEQPLPPVVEPLPVPSAENPGEVPPLEGTMPIPPAGDVPPAEVFPESVPTPLDEGTTTLEPPEIPEASFQGDGYGGLPGLPSGFMGGQFMGGQFGSLGPGMRGRPLLRGFHASASLTGTYSTNVAPNGDGDTDSGGESGGDFSMGLGGTISYMSTAPRFTFGGSYNGNYNQYFSQSDLSGYSQGASLMANYNAGKLYLSLNVGLSYDRGNNRYYDSEFVGLFNISTGFNARYQISSKTTISGNISTSFSATRDGNFDNSGSFDAGLSGFYRYSPKTEFGPGIHYGYQSADGGDNARTSIGPTFTMNYTLSKLIALNSMVGADFSSYGEGGDTDVSFNGSLGLSYTPSDLWSMSLSIVKGMQPDPSLSGGYIDTTSLSVGYNRKIRRASWSVNAGYSFDSSDDGGGAVVSDDDNQSTWSLGTSLGMAVFKNTCQASIFANYSDQIGGGSGESFDSLSVGFSLSRGF